MSARTAVFAFCLILLGGMGFDRQTAHCQDIPSYDGSYANWNSTVYRGQFCDDSCANVDDCCCECWSPSWYAMADALWLQRDRDNTVVLAEERTPGLTTAGFITTHGVDFDYEPGMRVTLGRAMCPESTWEISYYGLQDWDESATTTRAAGNSFSSTILFGPTTGSTTTESIVSDFSTQLHGAELNLRQWFSCWQTTFLAGVRYMHLNDQILLRGFDGAGGTGTLNERARIEGNNNLIGLQLGGDRTWRHNRLSVQLEGKAGLFLNFTEQRMNDDLLVVNPGFLVGRYIDTDRDDVALASIIDLSLIGNYRITEHIWLRGGYQVMVVSGLALAPGQTSLLGYGALDGLPPVGPPPPPINNATIPGDVNESGTLILDGFFAGFGVEW